MHRSDRAASKAHQAKELQYIQTLTIAAAPVSIQCCD
jgi:hypothetical protein